MQHCKLPSDWHHTHLSETNSTMSELRKSCYLNSQHAFELLTADFQTAGHGQKGTTWEADKGANLLFGFVFHPSFLPASQQFYLSEALALAVRSALAVYTDDVKVKWPNDVYWYEKKICGMLLEHTLSGNTIATTLTGVGINVNQQCFHGDAPNPVSLCQIVGHEVDRGTVLSDVIRAFVWRYDLIREGKTAEVHKEYGQYLYRSEGFHTFKDGEGVFQARIVSISPMGMLTLQKENGTQRSYAFKEVAFV